MGYLTKEIIKKLEKPIPEGMCAYSVCKKCGSVDLVDFETALALILLMPEEDLEKTGAETQWTDYYIETNFCPTCKNNSNEVSTKRIPKKT
ncbi:MAG TPA: hypothetical protein PK142_02170 [bacterium]|nr:hypothetical protein [bacterium]